MHRTKMNLWIMAGLLWLPILSNAATLGWPTFPVLSAKHVSQLLITEDCPAGEGRIMPGTVVRIENRFIPSDEQWNWVYEGDSQCHLLTDTLTYLSYQQTGKHKQGGDIITTYGTDGQTLFRFVFSFSRNWDCGPLIGTEPPMYIGCAQDMLKKEF